MSREKILKNIVIAGITMLITILLFISAGYIILQVYFPEPAIMQSVSSPDGKYTAYIFESNGGATTGWIYHISVLESGKKLGKGNGNVYVSGAKPKNIKWVNDNELYIEDYRSVDTTKQKQRINDVIIRYESSEYQ